MISCPSIQIHHDSSSRWYLGDVDGLTRYETQRRRAFLYLQHFLEKHDLEHYVTTTGSLIASNNARLMAKQNKAAENALVSANALQMAGVSLLLIENHATPQSNTDPLITEILIVQGDGFTSEITSERSCLTKVAMQMCAEKAKNEVCYFTNSTDTTVFKVLYKAFQEHDESFHSAVRFNAFEGRAHTARNTPLICDGLTVFGMGTVASKVVVSELLLKLNGAHHVSALGILCSRMRAISVIDLEETLNATDLWEHERKRSFTRQASPVRLLHPGRV